MSLQTTLPEELLIQIFVHLPARKIVTLSQLSKHWHEMIKDPKSQINKIFEDKWTRDKLFESFLEQTNVAINESENIEFLRAPIFGHIHPDLSYSGFGITSVTAHLSCPEDRDEDDYWAKEDLNKKFVEDSDIQEKSQPNQWPIMRQALLEILQDLDRQLDTDSGIELKDLENFKNLAKKDMAYSGFSDEGKKWISKFLRTRVKYQHSGDLGLEFQNLGGDDEYDYRMREYKQNPKWKKAIPFFMGAHSATDFFYPFLVLKDTTHVVQSKSQVLEMVEAIKGNAEIDDEFNHVDNYSEDNEDEESKFGSLHRLMEKMFILDEGSVTSLKIRLSEIGNVKKVKGEIGIRHCAEICVPQFLINELESIGQVQFVESANFASEEVSLYLIGTEKGPYVAGFIWIKERDS